MYLSEQYTMYDIANKLVFQEGFDILHINGNEEIWLEKYEQRVSKVVRLIHKGFDWKNYLKTDIAQVFQKIKAMDRLLVGKKVEIYNIYISSHTPIDDWGVLKKPLQLSEKNPPEMLVYYIDGTNKESELSRLTTGLGVSTLTSSIVETEDEMEREVKTIHQQLMATLTDKRNEEESVFSFGKPFFTYLLIILNMVMYFILETNGGSTDIENLIDFGAKFNPLIIDGEWWRIVSSMFLHIGFLHLFMNMLALSYLGTTVERIYGSFRFILIYFLAGIGGGVTSFAFSMSVSAGASGAIFGLFGALLFFGVMHKKIFFQTMGRGIITIVILNIIFGFTVSQIDIGAHLGGLIAGFLASWMFHLPRRRHLPSHLIAFVLDGALVVGLLLFGIQSTEDSAQYQVIKVEELLEDNHYNDVIVHTSKALNHPDDLEAMLLFQRSYAYTKLDDPELAIADLKESIHIDGDFAAAYYNLAELYDQQGESTKAKEMVEYAYDLKPDDESHITLYEKITGHKE